MSLTPQTIGIVKATAPVVAPHASAITGNFYKKMLGRHRELYQFFSKTNQSKGRQPHALANAVIAYASNIEHLERLTEPVKLMAVKHCALQIQPEHYQVVHDCLMESIGDILGDAVTPEIGQGWSEAVMFLANVLINEEKALYQKAEDRTGGWRGWQEFVLTQKTDLTPHAKVFRWERSSGDKTPFEFTPGEYMTVNLGLRDADLDFISPRHYTVCSEPGLPYLECAVKAVPGGIISNHLHQKINVGDAIKISPPFGAFKLAEAEAPSSQDFAFLSAGIGITPMIAFGKQLQSQGRGKGIKHIHIDASGEFPFKTDYYPQGGDLQMDFLESNSAEDRPSMRQLHEMLGDVSKKTIYACGPQEFMADVVPYFQTHAKKVEYENFGPRTEFPEKKDDAPAAATA